MKYDEIRAFSDPYFPVYGQTRICIFPRILFCPHTGKYGLEKARIFAYFTQWKNRGWVQTNKKGIQVIQV